MHVQLADATKGRDDALAQVQEVQERDLRVIQSLMDDVAKADVSLKKLKDAADAREARVGALEKARDEALMDADVLRAELEAAEQQRDALIAERDEEADAKAHALADADHVSEELMYLHSETARQAEHQTELDKKQQRAAREIGFLQEMLAKSKKKHAADAKASCFLASCRFR
jgi:chromosome segregation ATPase